MLEAAMPSMWSSVQSWCTPAVLFVLLNLVIATIAVTSNLIVRSSPTAPAADGNKLARSPSAVLDRLRSINLYRNDPPPLEMPQPPPEPQPSAVEATAEEREEPQHQFIRSQSDAQPTAGEMTARLTGKMQESASVKSAFAHFDEGDLVAEEAATKAEEEKVEVEEEEEEEEVKVVEEVDARADDFINRFKQQLKLQRLDSLVRYKDMLRRGH